MFSNNSLLKRLSLQKQLAALTLLGSMATGNVWAQQWEPLGSTPTGISSSWGSFQHLAKDASGNIYASFYDGSVTKGSVMKYDGNAWSYVGAAGITTGFATYNGLAVAGNGDIFYSNQASWPATGVEMRKFSGSTWTQLPTAGNTTANFQSLATTANNQPIVAYSSNGQPNVKRYDGTSWLNVGVGLPTETPYYIDLKVVNDTAYVGWTGTSGVRVFKIHALALGLASWQEVGTTGFAGTSSEQYRSAITVDASNNVYVAYTSTTANGNKINVKKYTLATGAWTDIGAANFSTHRVHYVSIAVTATGVPYVAYSHFENTPNNKNYVMKFSGTAWEQVGTDPVSSGEAKWNALLIDNAGAPMIAYSDESMTAGNMVKKFVSGTTACSNTMPGTTAGSTGCVTFNYQGSSVTYSTVRANDGNVWLQQNLGSAQVGNAKTDTLGYGHMFQWGRWDDGHQLRTSATGAAPSPNNPTGIGTGSTMFYTGSSTAAWWNGGALSDTWTATTNAQVTATDGCDPCKAMGTGWRLPTETEWAGVVSSETMTNTNTAFSSNLKLVVGGSRSFTNGSYSFEGVRGYYWSSTTSSTGAKYLYYSDLVMNASAGNNRGGGAAVRCIYSQTVGVTAVDVTTQNNVPATINTANGTLQLEAAVLPATANQNVTWTVQSGAAFASVSSTGLVTGLANGTATIRATSVSTPAQYDEIAVVVSTTSPCTAVSSFYENFDAPTLTCCNMGVVPECWASLSTGTGANQIISNTTPASGTNNIYQFGYGTGLMSIVVMREVNNINAGTHQFRFKVRANSGPGALNFGYITDINDASTFVTIQSITVSNSSYNDPAAERTLTVPTTVPSNARLAIRNPGTSWAGFYWDDVYWEPATPIAAQSVDVTTENNVAATITTNGGTLQTVATVLPLAADQNVTWSIVPGTGTASISATGLVTAQTNGIVYAKAIAVANASLADSIMVTISNQTVAVTDVTVSTINNAPATITVNDGTLPLQAIVMPTNATNSAVTWSIVPVSGAATISTTGIVTAETNGTVYAKAVTVENPAISDSLLITISNQGGVGIKEISKGLSFEMHPNPANTHVVIALSANLGTTTMTLISVDGRVLMQESFEGNRKVVDISNMPKGNYLLRLQTKDGYAIKKLVIE